MTYSIQTAEYGELKLEAHSKQKAVVAFNKLGYIDGLEQVKRISM